MKNEKLLALAAIITAAAEGKEIEYYCVDGWVTKGDPNSSWHLNAIYRVKPEPRRFWVNIYGNAADWMHTSRESADRAADSNRTECIEAVEVLK